MSPSNKPVYKVSERARGLVRDYGWACKALVEQAHSAGSIASYNKLEAFLLDEMAALEAVADAARDHHRNCSEYQWERVGKALAVLDGREQEGGTE
jgi:hypothetical protein